MGYNIMILEQSRDIEDVKIPVYMEQTCRDWDRWSKHNVVEQIDSGI